MRQNVINFIIIVSSIFVWTTKCYEDNFTSNSNDYIINTNSCKIPNISTFYPKFDRREQIPLTCTNFDPLLSYTSVQDGVASLHIREEAVKKYFGTLNSIQCCYSYIYRKGTKNSPDSGVASTDCFPFNTTVKLQHDLVWISCGRSGDTWPVLRGFPLFPIYENIHQVVTLTEEIKKKSDKLIKSTPKKPISVLMVVIDSVSRLNFIRTMPKTRDFLINNDFYEFIGYNKVGDNTFPNAMAFLTGLNLTDAEQICKPTEIDGLMNCPFIWYTFRNLGYATAYGEDWSSIATFNYNKKGFKNNPTDYYFKPYMDVLSYFKEEFQDNMPFCAGPENQGQRILNLAYDFAYQLKNIPKFGVFWMNTFSHEKIYTPKTMDNSVQVFFKKLKQSKLLEENIVIFLSDHGIRFGDIGKTRRGYYEVRLPMHFVSLPNWFKQEYPTETKNFEENTKKLTSNFDLYMTLKHVFKLSGLNENVTSSLACPQCKSLFEQIPVERTCEKAGIPDKWCTCNLNLPETEADNGYEMINN